ncbi:MAG: GNAT family protein [Candidatus Nanopelagicales bacterium]
MTEGHALLQLFRALLAAPITWQALAEVGERLPNVWAPYDRSIRHGTSFARQSVNDSAFAEKPTLVGRAVLLRPFKEDDLDVMWEMVNDPEGRWLTASAGVFTRSQMNGWYMSRSAQADRLDLAIVETGSGRCVGEVVLNELDQTNQSCNFRISLSSPQVRGRGLGTEAARLMLRHAFASVKVHRVELEVYSFNPRAQRSYVKAGFVVEGLRREALHWHDEWYDAIVMAALQEEWLDADAKS